MAKGPPGEQPSKDAAHVNWKQVAAFRLARHHLSPRAPAGAVTVVAGDICGAQAQVLSAAQMAFWPRVRGTRLHQLDSMVWKERSLVRAWCMRRTMYLVPSEKLAVFSRGSARRAEKEFRWVTSRGVSERDLEKAVGEVLNALDRPLTGNLLAEALSRSMGRRLKFRRGGGWGSRREVPWIDVGGMDLPIGYLLHVTGARGVICSGPAKGNESTFVRADRWVHGWKDMPAELAERKLLLNYLRGFGPASLADFALWVGMRRADAKEIWSKEAANIVEVDVEGTRGAVLKSDLPELEGSALEGPVVRLLPFFDSFLLGHQSHRNVVDARDQLKVYRNQGWVSPVLLVNGRAQGVWSHTVKKDGLHVVVHPFGKLPREVATAVREEADDLGRFLSKPVVETQITRG